jgi:hypothetical protein
LPAEGNSDGGALTLRAHEKNNARKWLSFVTETLDYLFGICAPSPINRQSLFPSATTSVCSPIRSVRDSR